MIVSKVRILIKLKPNRNIKTNILKIHFITFREHWNFSAKQFLVYFGATVNRSQWNSDKKSNKLLEQSTFTFNRINYLPHKLDTINDFVEKLLIATKNVKHFAKSYCERKTRKTNADEYLPSEKNSILSVSSCSTE